MEPTSQEPQKRTAGRRTTPGARQVGRRAKFRAWQDRLRDPSLSLLLALELAGVFVALPLAARGLLGARVLAETLLFVALAIVVMLSHRPGAIVAILLGYAALTASLFFGAGWPAIVHSVCYRGGGIITWSSLAWVVGHAVYAPGRITLRRLQGAVVVYLSLASIFASAYGLLRNRPRCVRQCSWVARQPG